MARAVFQIRHYAVDPNISQSKKTRSQETSVQISNSASSLTACLAFSKPKTRGVPGRIENAFDIVQYFFNRSCSFPHLWTSIIKINVFSIKWYPAFLCSRFFNDKYFLVVYGRKQEMLDNNKKATTQVAAVWILTTQV